MANHEFKFDVAISFARGQRDFARALHADLVIRGVKCFFDEVQQVHLWGQDLAEKFDEVFRKDAQFCVACVSQEWVERIWPSHERRSALARMIQEPGYLLPVRFDDAEVPGLSPSIAYLDGTEIEPSEVASLLGKKLAGRKRTNYLPPLPNRVLAALEIRPEDEEEELKARERAASFLSDLEVLTADERRLVITLLRYGCPCYLPESIHILADRLRRVTGWDFDQIRAVARSLRRVPGFSVDLLPADDGDDMTLEISWEPMGVADPRGKATGVAEAMVTEAGFGACDNCYDSALERLDFSRTSSMLDWSSDESAAFDASDVPPALRKGVQKLLDRGWTMEVAALHLRFSAPGASLFETVPLRDRHDGNSLTCASEALAQLLIGTEISVGS
ncbi:MAG: toll/interleukin-1 receptor domain-containing protein [Actinobacteria bacterium]|nr:toll/interleukin-1 receptor domain-containing protein [Actinomycetota bacterium]